MIHFPAHKMRGKQELSTLAHRAQRTHPPQTPIAPRRPRGLGDVLATVAQPIAKLLDRLLGTDLAHCSSCAHRRELLNRLDSKVSGLKSKV